MGWRVDCGLICFGQEVLDHMEPNLGQSIKRRAGQGPSEGTVGMAGTLRRAHPRSVLAMVRF